MPASSSSSSLRLSSHDLRHKLDQLFTIDSIVSVAFGVSALLAPHHVIAQLGGGAYNHAAHETFRLYGCLRLACGWILYHVRRVDDGVFRKHVCEALMVCYILQALSVLRAQFTDREFVVLNWIAVFILLLLAAAYGSFRFGKGGNMIKIYELPTSGTLQ